jgi:hypothetical protein
MPDTSFPLFLFPHSSKDREPIDKIKAQPTPSLR